MSKNETAVDSSESLNEESKEEKCILVNPSDPNTIPKFVDKLPLPYVEKSNLEIDEYGGERQTYRITMRESKHYFSSYFPPTKVWGYNGLYPGPTIEAFKNIPTYVLWENQLPKKHFFAL